MNCDLTAERSILLDKKIIVKYFPSPHSRRGETVIEFKSCAIRALDVDTIKLLSGDAEELAKDTRSYLAPLGDGVYGVTAAVGSRSNVRAATRWLRGLIG